jgi:hypothetical protein
MKRRLYFLFPNEAHTQQAIDTLQRDLAVKPSQIHVVADYETRTLRHPHTRLLDDKEARFESRLWSGNLALFFIALAIFLAALGTGMPMTAAAAVVVMFATFIAGLMFATRLPHAHISQFREALSHREILLILDLPQQRVQEVEHYVHHHYPDAVTGGVGWHSGLMGH